MNVIENRIFHAIESEYINAVATWGLHNSEHEKYAVALEELQEAKESLQMVERCMDEAFKYIRQNRSESEIESVFADAYKHAKHSAIECCQIAAVCKKGIEHHEEKDII